MRGIFVIAGRDVRSMFGSPLFYVLGGLCTLIWSGIFYSALGQAVLSARFMGGGTVTERFVMLIVQVGHTLLLVAIPAITMRLFAEEKRQRTFDLLLTSPVTATQIVAGKMFAGFILTSVLLFISLIYPISLATMTEISWPVAIANYLGILLLAGVYASAGVFASSLTESPFLSIIAAVMLNILILLLGSIAGNADEGPFKAVLDHLSVHEHLQVFMQGSIGTTAIVFFLSVIFFFSFLTQRVVDSVRWR